MELALELPSSEEKMLYVHLGVHAPISSLGNTRGNSLTHPLAFPFSTRLLQAEH